jgi:hypothetical protein
VFAAQALANSGEPTIGAPKVEAPLNIRAKRSMCSAPGDQD